MREEEARKIILSPLLTEKSTSLQEKNNQYLFRVHPRGNKIQIKQAVEKIFHVHVTEVRTIRVKKKKRRIGRSEGYRSGWRKAVVSIKAGEKIEFT